jgi:hypothetical protein
MAKIIQIRSLQGVMNANERCLILKNVVSEEKGWIILVELQRFYDRS